MLKRFKPKKISSLRALLLYWIGGSGLGLVALYSGLMEYQFRFGVEIRSQVHFERYASVYEAAYQKDPQTPLPQAVNMVSYGSWRDMPLDLKDLLRDREIDSGEVEIFFYEDDDYDIPQSAFTTLKLCGNPSCEILFVYGHQLSSGKWLYMVQGLIANDQLHREKDLVDIIMIYITLCVLAIFAGIALLLVRKIDKPVQKLSSWANQLTVDNLSKRPDFDYQELNQVAGHLNNAFVRIKESVDKEHRFLQQLSHELRTPLATALGNLDILNLTASQAARSETEQNAITRLSYAVNDMKQLSETLLWLNREEESLPQLSSIYLHDIVETIIVANRYLIGNKPVTVEISGDRQQIESHETLCSIVINNLIRNAFQYTFDGRVIVFIEGDSITVANENTSADEQSGETGDYGFGLGLSLVSQIAKRLNWPYSYSANAQGWSSTVKFGN